MKNPVFMRACELWHHIYKIDQLLQWIADIKLLNAILTPKVAQHPH